MSAKIHIVNFGQAFGGLLTVGYTILNVDGTTKVARATSGIVEYGTATGIYGANIEYNQFDQLVVLWDTGGGSPKYAVEENRTTLASIQEGTDVIRLIWNTLRNQGDIFTDILKALKKLESTKNYDKDFNVLAEQLKGLIGREEIHLKDIKEALNINVSAPDVKVPAPIVTVHPTPVTVNAPKMPDIKIPDYTASLNAISKMLDGISKETKPQLGGINQEIAKLKTAISSLEMKHGLNSDKAINHLGVVNSNIKSLHEAMQVLIQTVPPSQMLSVLKDTLNTLTQIENQSARAEGLKKVLKNG